MISKSSKHAILALTFLAKLPRGEYAGANHIAEKIKAPKNYLGKILNKLAAEGHLESVKGYNGGFKLSKPASEITIYDITDPIENMRKWNICFLGANECACESNCAVHDNWHKIRQDYIRFLKGTTLEMICRTNITITNSDDL
jgi:Rrf2 family protein